MRVTLDIQLERELYQLEDWREAEKAAASSGGEVYSWKTSGWANWLQRGYSIVDVLGLVVLPSGLPDYVEMAPDTQ